MTDGVATEPERSPPVELHSERGGEEVNASPDVEPVAPQPPIPDPDAASSNLAPAEGLVPRFPLEEAGTGLVLYDSAPGELRAHWSLARTEMERFGASFPVNGSRPAPVLRLRRLRPEGVAELVDEVSLLGVARERSGDASFRVEPDQSRYHAELGLATGDGGWLMLARSNGLDYAAGIGLRLPVSEEGPLPLGPTVERSAEPDPIRAQGRGGPVSGAADGPGVSSAGDLLGSVSPPAPHTPPVDASLHPAEPVRPDSAHPFSGLIPQFPLVEPAQCRSVAESDASTLRSESPAAPSVEGVGASPESAATGLLGDAHRSLRPTTAQAPPISRSIRQDPRLAPPDPETPTARVRIDPFVYGAAPTRVNGLRLEAELRILGEAVPGSIIDLLGHPFQVGPGGRFLLTLRVDDPDLLRRALELQPPIELKARRDD